MKNSPFQTWTGLSDEDKGSAQNALDCCGFFNVNETVTCEAECVGADNNRNGCQSCHDVLYDKVDYGFNSAGGVGLFFAFTEVRKL